MAKLDVANVQRYSSHGFRRGASNEPETRGSSGRRVHLLGESRSLAFAGYVGLAPAKDIDVAKLLIEMEDIDSGIGGELRTLGAGSRFLPARSTLGVGGPKLAMGFFSAI